MISKKIKIFLIIGISFLFSITINDLLFFEGSPKVNPFKYKLLLKNVKNNFIIAKNNIIQPLTDEKKAIYKNSFDFGKDYYFTDFELIETPSPTITTFFLKPTNDFKLNINQLDNQLDITPYLISPTIFYQETNLTPTVFIPTKTKLITKPTITPILLSPTKKIVKSKIKKTESNVLENTNEIAVFIKNPLDQPYYNPNKAYLCYTPDNFIKLYANGVSKENCYSKVKAEVEKNLTSVSIMGKSISVHKKAYPAFKAVADKLKYYKDYKINTIGSYVFRCNVNASSSGRNDLCSDGCVLSTHSFGIAVDINWDENCNGCSNFTMPMEIVDAFESYGFRWGGRYKSIFGATIDPMHFEYMYDLCKDL